MSNIKKVPFFDYPRLYLDDREHFLEIFDSVASNGAFIMQKDLSDFESSLSNYVSSKYAVGVANATDGLEIAWMSIGLNPGDEVICSSHTMLATASSIKAAGGTPIPVDIGYDGLICPQSIERAITKRTVGIMPTQLNGRTCNMDPILDLASTNNLHIVEDAAQALGSKFKNKYAGTFGNVSAFSFYPAKVLGCFGDAGGVVTDDPVLYDKVYQLHDHGRDVNGDVKSWGRNSRLDNLQAAYLNYKLKDYSAVIARRRFVADLYDGRLKNLHSVSLPPSPNSNPDHFDVYQNYEITADNRDELKHFLASKGIGTLIQWGGKGVHQWKYLGFSEILPATERFFEKCIMLPMNVFISDSDAHYVCDQVLDFYGC